MSHTEHATSAERQQEPGAHRLEGLHPHARHRRPGDLDSRDLYPGARSLHSRDLRPGARRLHPGGLQRLHPGGLHRLPRRLAHPLARRLARRLAGRRRPSPRPRLSHADGATGRGRLAATVAAVVLVAGACSAAAAPSQPAVIEVEQRDLLYAGTPAGLAAIDADDGEIAYSAAGAVPAGDWSALFTSMPYGPNDTELFELDPATGEDRWSLPIEGQLTARLVSPAGEAVALTPSTSGDPYFPTPKETSTIVVARTDGSEPRTYELDGNIEPEAFSVDTGALFVIEYFPPLQPERYQVRRLDLGTGEVEAVFDLDNNLQTEMSGTARNHVRSPDGRRLYTLYSIPGDEPQAFVHVLDLAEEWAHCVDLPVDLTGVNFLALSITVSEDGSEVYVLDRESGAVAGIDTTSLEVVSEGQLAPEAVGDPTVTHVAGDTLWIGGGGVLRAVDLATLTEQRSFAVPNPITGLALTAGGDGLFVAEPQSVRLLDAETGEMRWTHALTNGPVLFVGERNAPLPVNLTAYQCAC